MPGHEVPFANIRDVVEDFCQHFQVEVKSIQRCEIGQAYVHFEFVHDCDRLIHHSPLNLGNLSFTVMKHNRCRNWRALTFNHECWLMFLGFLHDFWDQYSIENAIKSFARLISWEKDPDNLARLLIRARVTDLHKVPEFIVLTEGEGFNG